MGWGDLTYAYIVCASLVLGEIRGGGQPPLHPSPLHGPHPDRLAPALPPPLASPRQACPCPPPPRPHMDRLAPAPTMLACPSPPPPAPQAIPTGLVMTLSLFGGFVVSMAGPNMRAAMLNVNEPETRGVALALQSVTDDLGKGAGGGGGQGRDGMGRGQVCVGGGGQGWQRCHAHCPSTTTLHCTELRRATADIVSNKALQTA